LSVSLERVNEEELITLNRLVELAAYDLSEFNGSNINEYGLFLSDFDSKSWFDNPNSSLYFIRVEGALAGFLIIKKIIEENIYYLNHFFILKRFRRKNIGKDAAIKAFNLLKGDWRVSEFDWNTPAQSFWRKVIKDYTNNKFSETRRKDNKGPAQEFTNLEY